MMGKWILQVPVWEGEIQFNYDTVSFLLVPVTLLAGLVLCFMGYKYLQALFLLVFGCLLGAAGVRIADGLTQNPVLEMCLFVIFTFLGICLLYAVSIPAVLALNKLHIKEIYARHGYLISALLGAGVVGTVTFVCVCRSILVAPMSLALFAAGTLWGRKQAAKRKVFRTYDDLCERKPLAGEGGASCSISAEES